MVKLDWSSLETEYANIIKKLSNSSLDKKERAELQKTSSQYSDLLSKHKEINNLEKEFSDLKKQAVEETDEEMKTLFNEEIVLKEENLKIMQKELDTFLYPADERDKRSVFIEIRAGAGGQESALFVDNLFRMYSNYALTHGWNVSIVDFNSTDIGGYKELVIYIKGKYVFKHLKFESGVHRVQRVPQTETSGRIHTSTVTVVVLPEAKEVDVQINPNDLRIDTYRAGGAGGQHVNKTDSAVRITHIPTGLVVACQDERSQIKNKAKALKVLASRILEMEREKKEAELSAQRKQQTGTGMRAEKIRTYNYPQNRVTDHRINLTLKKLDLIMEGNLDDLIKPLMEWESIRKRENKSLFLK
ncbi:peptide chain release factor 1 [Candidatus Dependentiae bacterium]